MSLFTSKMKLLSAVVIEEKSERVTAALLNLGVLDFVSVSSIFDMGDYHLVSSDVSGMSEFTELRRRIESIYKQAGIDYPFREILKVEQMKELDMETARKTVDDISLKIQAVRDKQKKLHQEKLKLEEITNYLGKSDGKSSAGKGFLVVNKGRPGRGKFDDLLLQLGPVPHFGTEIPESDSFLLVSLKRDGSIINDVLTRFLWSENDEQKRSDSEKSMIAENIRREAEQLGKEIESTSVDIKEYVLKEKVRFDELWKSLRLHELFEKVRGNFSHTQKTCLFSGWLPAARAGDVERSILNASDGECIIEWSEPEEFKPEAVPVEIRQPRGMAPFKMLVENYAIPEYGTIDPTFFVAVAYLIMFGLMFGDAGQGLVIAVIGILGRRFMKKASEGTRNLLQLFIYCGSASIITGVLFGSYFGYKLFQPLWFDYHGIVFGHGAEGSGGISNVYDILRITIYFGITVIGAGLVINWINLYRKKDYFHLFLDKSGILGGWVYGCGVYTSFYFVGAGYKSLPDSNLLMFFFGIPAIILLFKAPLHFYLYERGHKKFDMFSIIDFFMEWIVEILEIFSGYLSNTLSFMRVAGLGIAHVSLMVAFDTMAKMTSGLPAILILLAGNILVIGLEGLSAGIQALRLNYYEFFSRYFTGKGIAYNPVSLRSRKQEG